MLSIRYRGGAPGSIVALARCVNESALAPAELEAIQAAIREVSVPLRAQTRPIPILPVDREMSMARAELIDLGSRWAEEAPRQLRGQLPGAWQLHVTDIVLIDGASAAIEARNGWIVAAHTGGAPDVALSIHGPLIEAVAARRCGDPRARVDGRRPPSAAALRLFDPIGWAVMQSWTATWKSPARRALQPTSDAGAVSKVFSRPELLRIALTWSGGAIGKCILYAAPSALVAAAVPAPVGVEPRAALDRLADVPVELRVELGTLQLVLEQLRQLQPGACFALPTFVDARVPVYVGGVLKAWGTPVVHRGVLAVAIEQVVGGKGFDGEDAAPAREPEGERA